MILYGRAILVSMSATDFCGFSDLSSAAELSSEAEPAGEDVVLPAEKKETSSKSDLPVSDLTMSDFLDVISSYTVDDSIPSYADYLEAQDGRRPEKEIVIDAADYIRYSDGSMKFCPS